VNRLGLGLLSVTLLAISTPAMAGVEPCSDLVPSLGVAPSANRPLGVDDLVKLRDIGPNITFDSRLEILSLSPDGTRVAFQLRRAEPTTNSYCIGMFVVSLSRDERPVRVDSGGELIRYSQSLLGITDYPSGSPIVITPRWSPDGRSIAYFRRDRGVTQVWVAQADGSAVAQVTHADFDIEDFAWTSDGKGLVISGRPGLTAANMAIEQEGQSGFLYDDRYMPLARTTPFPRNDLPTVQYAVDLHDGAMIPLSGISKNRTMPASDQKPVDAILFAQVGARAVWTKRSALDNIGAPKIMQIQSSDGQVKTCDLSVCENAIDLWPSATDDTLYYMRREGWRASQTAIYRWKQGEPAPARVLLTDDVLLGCQRTAMQLVCAEEGSLQPRRIVAIDLGTGRQSVVFDANPEMAGFRLGAVRRLYWKNNLGLEAFGDLVLPPNHKPGQRHPLIVVQYDSRGFLRGGTNDEYPIQLFAAAGFAVLSFHHPRTVGVGLGAKTWEEANRLNHDNWADRKSIQSALEVGLSQAIATGAVDPDHMGITGVSDGSNMLQFALINSRLFRAAASSSCCEDPGTLLPLSGITGAQMMIDMGYPRLTAAVESYWRPYSLADNAKDIHVPLLMQLADTEYLAGLETFMALREAGDPTEMFVYPDEFHEKWQPSHRLAVYQRNVDWFAFWLAGREDPDPAKIPQYARWRALRSHPTDSSSGASPVRH
jgi:dipeptidyl aminopeptidase/acylaminoacyl peptidase